MRIFLTGFMAAGKTTFGKALSKEMKLEFLDLDALIESSTHMTIDEVFQKKGEGHFRAVEQETLKQSILQDNFIMSTGGGTPAFFENQQLMKEAGIVVFLNTPVTILIERLFTEKNKRPLIKNVPIEELPYRIEQRLSERMEFYRQAHLIINPETTTPKQLSRYLF